MTRIRLGISTCPNDTFAFHGLLAGKIPTPGIEFEIELHDVETLNEALLSGAHDVVKGSFAAAFEVADQRVVLPVGAALGFDNGPLLLAPERDRPGTPERVVLGPGRHTTAELLFRLYHPEETGLRSVLFSEVMPALENGEADLGICIHEGRFTYAGRGLRRVEDLGERWTAATGCPLPLGGLFAQRDLGAELTAAVQTAIEASLRYSRENPQEALSSMRRYAQEHSDDVLNAHVKLYVTDDTDALSPEGERAIARLQEEAGKAGVLDANAPRLGVFRR